MFLYSGVVGFLSPRVLPVVYVYVLAPVRGPGRVSFVDPRHTTCYSRSCD
jgi:cytochrome c biogenesis protein CcdA